MEKPKDPRTDQIKKREQQPTDPGPTTGDTDNAGQRPAEPTGEEKREVGPKEPPTKEARHTGPAATRGVAGFHHDPQAAILPEGSRGPASPASMQLDPDRSDRVNTGTGDQPGNTGGSRTGTPPEPSPDSVVPHAPDSIGNGAEDLDDEPFRGRGVGLPPKDALSEQ